MGPEAGSDTALDVCWAGVRPAWLDEPDAALELESIRFVAAPAGAVIHLAPDASIDVGEARRTPQEPRVVLDLGDGARGTTPDDFQSADRILVDSLWDAEQLAARQPGAAERIAVAPSPIDLARFAPQSDLLHAHGSLLKRFKRYHRLGEPCLLFVGPYTPAGGLDLVIEAAFLLRAQFPDVRVAAIPAGPIDHAFLGACERRILGLGHRGIVEWETAPDEIPFWYATATVVCTPWRGFSGAGAATPARFAAAAGRPFIGSDIGPLRTELAHDSDWATLVTAGDAQDLATACAGLFEDPTRADERGAVARAGAVDKLSPRAAARRLVQHWRGENAAAANGA